MLCGPQRVAGGFVCFFVSTFLSLPPPLCTWISGDLTHCPIQNCRAGFVRAGVSRPSVPSQTPGLSPWESCPLLLPLTCLLWAPWAPGDCTWPCLFAAAFYRERGRERQPWLPAERPAGAAAPQRLSVPFTCGSLASNPRGLFLNPLRLWLEPCSQLCVSFPKRDLAFSLAAAWKPAHTASPPPNPPSLLPGVNPVPCAMLLLLSEPPPDPLFKARADVTSSGKPGGLSLFCTQLRFGFFSVSIAGGCALSVAGSLAPAPRQHRAGDL